MMVVVVVGCGWVWGGGEDGEGGGMVVVVRIVRTEKPSNYLPVPFSLAVLCCAVTIRSETDRR